MLKIVYDIGSWPGNREKINVHLEKKKTTKFCAESLKPKLWLVRGFGETKVATNSA